MIYDRLGRHAYAAALLAKIKQLGGDAAAYQYAEIFTQWGDRKAALDWLEKAMRLCDPGLVYTKVDPLMDPMRIEPRFQAATQATGVSTVSGDESSGRCAGLNVR